MKDWMWRGVVNFKPVAFKKKAQTPRFFLTSSHEGSNSKNWLTSEHLKQATDIQMWISLVMSTTLLQRRRVMLGNIGDNNGNDINEDEENSLPLLRRPPPPLLQTKNTKQNRQTKKRTKMENAFKSYPRLIFKRGVSGCTIGLLQLTITWYKIRHAGRQAHYYSRIGTSKQRQVKLHRFSSLCFNVPLRE